MKKYYVAYGSNMNLGQMDVRCPGATVFCTGYLRDWRLIFRGRPNIAYASIEKQDGSFVPVIIWEISEKCEKALDRYEGYPSLYKKRSVSVETDRGDIEGMIYVMNKECVPGRPSKRYIEVIRKGYEDNDLDIGPLNEALRINRIELK